MYCRECGKEISDNDRFCPHCGEPVTTQPVQYTRPGRSFWSAGRIVTGLIGGMLILISIPILFGGVVVTGVMEEMDIGSGYIGFNEINLKTDTQSLIFKEIRIDEYVFESINNPFIDVWSIDPEDFIGVRFHAESNNGKEIFVGIISEKDAQGYLGKTEYEYITEVNMEKFDDPFPYIEYRKHQGELITVNPEVLSSWVAFEKGRSIEYLQWEPTYGEYWLVLMNGDLSSGVDVDVDVGVRVPFISAIGNGLIAAGLLCLIVGAVIIYFGVIRQER